MGIESVQALTFPAATAPPQADAPSSTLPEPPRTLAGSLLAQREKVGLVGLASAYFKAVRTDTRFLGEVIQLLKDNDIPMSDHTALKIVSALHFLENIAPRGIGSVARGTMEKVTSYAHDKLQNFLSAYQSNAKSGGTNPPNFVVTNARNDALFMVNKYFGTTDIVVPDVQRDEHIPVKGEVGV